MGIDLVVLALAAMDGSHVEGMAQDKGNVLFQAEIGQPVPGEHASTQTTMSSRYGLIAQ